MQIGEHLNNNINQFAVFVPTASTIIVSCLLFIAFVLAVYSVTVYIPKRLNQIEERIKKLENKEK